MNVASLELCRELYELSGWSGTELNHYMGVVSWASLAILEKDAELAGQGEPVPAYDLGYLLRKLPYGTNITKWETPEVKGYSAYYDYDAESGTTCDGPTPEDAACSLAVELINDGVLTSEHKTAKPQASPPRPPELEEERL